MQVENYTCPQNVFLIDFVICRSIQKYYRRKGLERKKTIGPIDEWDSRVSSRVLLLKGVDLIVNIRQ